MLSLNFLGRLISKIPSSRDVGFSNGMRGMIDLRVALIYVSDEKSMEAININFMLYLWIRQFFANLLFEGLNSLLPGSTIEPVIPANLMVSLCH